MRRRTALRRKTGLRRKSRRPNRILEDKLDAVFSLYVRARDQRCMMGEMFPNCAGVLQAGHVIPKRGHKCIRWDERNAYGQCAGHNRAHSYDNTDYFTWFTKTRGIELFHELERRGRQACRPSVEQLRKLISYYEHKIRELAGN